MIADALTVLFTGLGLVFFLAGTLVAGSEGDRLLVHALDRAARPGEALRAEEARLAPLFPPARPEAGPEAAP